MNDMNEWNQIDAPPLRPAQKLADGVANVAYGARDVALAPIIIVFMVGGPIAGAMWLWGEVRYTLVQMATDLSGFLPPGCVALGLLGLLALGLMGLLALYVWWDDHLDGRNW